MNPAHLEYQWYVPDAEAAWMVFSGYVQRLDDGTLEMTAKGAEWLQDWLKRKEACSDGS